MERIKELAAMAALNKMFKQGHFSICTIDSVAEMLCINPRGRAYSILRTLHCVDFSAMPKELQDEVPCLIRECLSLDTIYEFEHLKRQTVIVKQSAKERLLGYISGRIG